MQNLKTIAKAGPVNYPDSIAYAPSPKLVFVSDEHGDADAAESGNVAVFREEGKTLVNAGSLYMPHAHTVSVDPETHLVYFPLQNVDGHPLLRIMEPSPTN